MIFLEAKQVILNMVRLAHKDRERDKNSNGNREGTVWYGMVLWINS